ncbi:MAG: DNA primase [Chitinophagales bacterium]|nr:DNA primase [Chitinophagales bacterium]
MITASAPKAPTEMNFIDHDEIIKQFLVQIKPINFFERVELEDDGNLKKHHFVIETIEEVLSKAKELNWSIGVKNGTIYVFNGAYWKSLEKNEIEAFLGKSAELLGVDKYDAKYHMFKTDLLKQLISSAYIMKVVKPSDEVLINLQNGTFVINSKGYFTKAFDQADFLRYQLPFALNNDASCELFVNFLNKVLPDVEQQNILAEYIAYVFVRLKTLKLEKCLVLYGKGANGKSVFFDIISALLGSENISSYSLQSLTNESGYQRASLGSKLLNYASEISSHMDSSYFKQLVSGEAIEARLPYGSPFILEDYAKFIFNANDLPRDIEQNEAFFRRFIIIKFDVTIPENERDPELAQKIIKTELPGIFNWVLQGLDRLLKNKTFTHSEAVKNTLNDYKLNSDTVYTFIEDFQYEKSNTNEIRLHQLYTEYKKYTSESGNIAPSKRFFAERLRNMGYEIPRKNTGKVVYAQKKGFQIEHELHSVHSD